MMTLYLAKEHKDADDDNPFQGPLLTNDLGFSESVRDPDEVTIVSPDGQFVCGLSSYSIENDTVTFVVEYYKMIDAGVVTKIVDIVAESLAQPFKLHIVPNRYSRSKYEFSTFFVRPLEIHAKPQEGRYSDPFNGKYRALSISVRSERPVSKTVVRWPDDGRNSD